MADATDHRAAAQAARLTFERVAGYMLVGVSGLYALIGLWSKDMADRIVELAPALSQLGTVIGGVMAASWFRGHMDNRIDNQGRD